MEKINNIIKSALLKVSQHKTAEIAMFINAQIKAHRIFRYLEQSQ